MDIDIDFARASDILEHIKHVPAAQLRNEKWQRHASGVYVTAMPQDPITGWASIDYQEAERRGYFKIDFLNVSVYQLVRDAEHLDTLMNTEPSWHLLEQRDFVQQLVHIGNHYDLLQAMPQPVKNIEEMAQFLAIIRPSKRHLAGKTWSEVSKTVWDRTSDGSYVFRKAHAFAYAQLVMVHMNLLNEAATPV
jgi:hypothetical protein